MSKLVANPPSSLLGVNVFVDLLGGKLISVESVGVKLSQHQMVKPSNFAEINLVSFVCCSSHFTETRTRINGQWVIDLLCLISHCLKCNNLNLARFDVKLFDGDSHGTQFMNQDENGQNKFNCHVCFKIIICHLVTLLPNGLTHLSICK